VQDAFGVSREDISKSVAQGLGMVRGMERSAAGLNAPGAAVRRAANVPPAQQGRFAGAKSKMDTKVNRAKVAARKTKEAGRAARNDSRRMQGQLYSQYAGAVSRGAPERTIRSYEKAYKQYPKKAPGQRSLGYGMYS